MLLWCSFAFWKMVLRLVLVEAHEGEDERHRRELCVEDPDARLLPRQARDRDGDDRERDVEREQVDRRRVHVDAPRDREPDPDEIERERPRHDAELTRPLVPVHELPEQQARGPERDRVQRHEERVAEEADPERDERERGEGDEPRLAAEEPGEQRPEHDHSGNGRPDLRRVRRGQRDREQDSADSGVAEAGDPVPAPSREEEDGEADAGDRAGDLREADHFACTRTTAVAACPFSVTTRWYVPGVVGARSRRRFPRRSPCLWPRRHV